MAADFNTEILIKGTNEELLAMVMVLKKYVTEKHEQYNKEHNCAYLESVYINGRDSLSMITDEQIKEIVQSSNGTINVEAMGPYGIFGFLWEVPLFENMAEVAPNAYFEGLMSGFNPGGDQAQKGVLENKKLHIFRKYPDDFYDEDDEETQDVYIEPIKKSIPFLKYDEDDKEAQDEYIEAIEKLLPYSKFVKLFKIDKEEFKEEDYVDFIFYEMIENEFPEIDYEDFIDAVYGCSKIDEDSFYDITEELSESGVVCYEDYDAGDDEWDEENTYDPIAKKWN